MSRRSVPDTLKPAALRDAQRLLPLLDEKSSEALAHRWGAFGRTPLTISGVAKRLDVSVLDVPRLMEAGLTDLRLILGAKWPA